MVIIEKMQQRVYHKAPFKIIVIKWLYNYLKSIFLTNAFSNTLCKTMGID